MKLAIIALVTCFLLAGLAIFFVFGLNPATTISAQLGSPVEEVQNRAYASAIILTVIILILSFSARYFSSKFSKNKI